MKFLTTKFAFSNETKKTLKIKFKKIESKSTRSSNYYSVIARLKLCNLNFIDKPKKIK